MGEEHIKYEGRLALNRQERVKLSLKMQGLVRSLRDLLDPTRPVERLETELIAQQSLELASSQIDYKELLQQAEIIKNALGR